MSEIVCGECRKPMKELLVLYAKGGYADGPRVMCRPCFDGSQYHQNRFTPRPMPDPVPEWVRKNWTL